MARTAWVIRNIVVFISLTGCCVFVYRTIDQVARSRLDKIISQGGLGRSQKASDDAITDQDLKNLAAHPNRGMIASELLLGQQRKALALRQRGEDEQSRQIKEIEESDIESMRLAQKEQEAEELEQRRIREEIRNASPVADIFVHDKKPVEDKGLVKDNGPAEQMILPTNDERRKLADEEAVKKRAASPNEPPKKMQKFLIYLCDKTTYCYGFADRQRGIVSTYYLAEMTNRRFGIIMTSPSDIRDFYEPNLVNWNIPQSALPKNATTIEVSALGLKQSLHLDTLDFNKAYPQDIVYMRTNHVFWIGIRRNPIYNGTEPKWARISYRDLNAAGWLRLMRPTTLLRQSLNSALIDIAQRIQTTADTWKRLNTTGCCKRGATFTILPACGERQGGGGGNITQGCTSDSKSEKCCAKLKQTFFVGCPELQAPCAGIDTKACTSELSSTFGDRLSSPRIWGLADDFCTMPQPYSRLNGTIEYIRSKKDYDLTDLRLVCAHIRLGKGSTDFNKFETHMFNNRSSVRSVWDFLKKFSSKGYHIYLASDDQEVKEEAKAIFGERLHMQTQEIVHVGAVQQGQDAKAGMLFSLTEQLLLTTSCSEFLMSHSGFSGRAMEMRRILNNGRVGKVYRFEKGVVT